jgi:hypothetical protein
MEPFRVKCIDCSFSGGALTTGHNYTVVKVEGSFYYLADQECLGWSSDRFVEFDEEVEYWRARWEAEAELKRASLSPKEAAYAEGQPFHLVAEGIRNFNTATNLVAALNNRFRKCHFELTTAESGAESGAEYSVVENPPNMSISKNQRKYMKLFAAGFLAALP